MRTRVFKKIGLFAAGISVLLMTAGCELLGIQGGNSVKFAASSNMKTKAIYGDDEEENGVLFQQIVWQEDDEIRIVSDHAQTAGGSVYADYKVSRTGDYGRNSYGTLSTLGEGLRWDEDWTYAYEFWAMYPAAAATSMDDRGFSGRFAASIPGTDFLMVAHSPALYGQSKIVLEFYPAFTAFRIDVNADVEGVTINSLSLSAPDNAPALTGSFTAQIGDTGITDCQVIEGTTSQTATSSIREDIEGSDYSSFVIFCLPAQLSNLTLHCNYTQNGEAKTKKLKLVDNAGNFMTFSACKQHRMTLTLKASEGGDIEFNLTIGGAQMILSILADQLTQWGGEGMKIAMRKFGMDPDNQSGWWDGTHQDFWDFWNALQNKPINYFNQFVSNVDKTNPPDCRVVFDSSNGYFTVTELEVIRDFLQTVTYYTHKTTLSESIDATDFNMIPNLEEIKQEEIDQGTVTAKPGVSITIDGLTKLEKIDLHKWPNITIKNCPNLTSLNITNTLQVTTTVLVESCPSLTSFRQDGSGYDFHFTFSKMDNLETLYMNDAAELTVSECPKFREFSFQLAKHLTNLTLNQTPVFEKGTTTNHEATTAVVLNACSTSHPGATIKMQGNGTAVNAGKTNSGNVTVTFVDYGGNTTVTF